jgi:serine/threonine protein kinase
LQELILRRRDSPGRDYIMGETTIRNIFSQVLNGLREVHANKLLHLDIKPANIYLLSDATPILLDFGAARQTLHREDEKLYPMYTPGFAAPELHSKSTGLGPWTDIYSVGAAMFACISGAPPQAADARKETDKVASALKQYRAHYSPQLLQLIEWCLKMDSELRPQSVFAVQKLLLEEPQPEENTGLFKKLYQQFSGQGKSKDKGKDTESAFPTDWR